jgi:hypothetical protein
VSLPQGRSSCDTKREGAEFVGYALLDTEFGSTGVLERGARLLGGNRMRLPSLSASVLAGVVLAAGASS